jgi:hypothetical protein
MQRIRPRCVVHHDGRIVRKRRAGRIVASSRERQKNRNCERRNPNGMAVYGRRIPKGKANQGRNRCGQRNLPE